MEALFLVLILLTRSSSPRKTHYLHLPNTVCSVSSWGILHNYCLSELEYISKYGFSRYISRLKLPSPGTRLGPVEAVRHPECTLKKARAGRGSAGTVRALLFTLVWALQRYLHNELHYICHMLLPSLHDSTLYHMTCWDASVGWGNVAPLPFPLCLSDHQWG